MKLLKCILLSVACFITCGAGLDPSDTTFGDAPTIRVRQGYLRGIKERTLKGIEFYSYKSIPYAQPPVGQLRFKDPIPSSYWPGVLNAINEPNFCMQKLNVNNDTDHEPKTLFYAKEDCLYLKVYTPKTISSSFQFPVMVYIHGGLFVMGGAQKMTPYVMMDKDIVLVVLQYRLGIFGFLSTEDFVLPGNMGLKDQQLALRWIKENIASFGGDPNRITIFGDSAGGSSVHFHILSPGSKGLFHRAIMMSGTAFVPFAYGINHRNYAIEAGNYFGCSLDFGTQYYLSCMQDVPASEMQSYAHNLMKWEYLAVATIPRVDGEFLPNFPEILMKEGKYNEVEMLAGVTRDESVYMLQVLHDIPGSFEELRTQFDLYGPVSLMLEDEQNSVDLARKAYHHYLKKDITQLTSWEKNQEKLLKLYSDRHIKDGYDLGVHFFLKKPDTSMYLYEFDYVGQFIGYDSLSPRKHKWVAHDDDILYLFAGGPFLINMTHENDLKVQEFMVTMWTNFAKTGNPTPEGSSIIWEKANAENMRQLSLKEQPKMIAYDHTETRKFWGSLDTQQNRLLSSIGY